MIDYQVGKELFCVSIYSSRRTQRLTVESVGTKNIYFKGRPKSVNAKVGENVLFEANSAIGRLYHSEAEYNSIHSELQKRDQLQRRLKALMSQKTSNKKIEKIIEILEKTDE